MQGNPGPIRNFVSNEVNIGTTSPQAPSAPARRVLSRNWQNEPLWEGVTKAKRSGYRDDGED